MAALTDSDLDALATTVVGTIKAALAPVLDRLAAAESEIKALKARPLPKWAGVHVDGKRYEEAQLVTRAGSLWIATAETDATPGSGNTACRLIVKAGAR